MDCSSLRQNMISFMALKFPIGELISSGEYLDPTDINKKLDGAYDIIHTLLRAINLFEFEYLYKFSQMDMHWHMRNPLLHVKYSKQAKEELNSPSISQNSYKSIIQVYNEKLNEEMNRSLSLEQEKIHWENEYKLLCKKKENIPLDFKDKHSAALESLVVENELGKCESVLQLNDQVLAREKELKCYFEKKINNLISTNKELSSQSNAYAMEITALKTRLDHSIFVRNDLEIKLHEASEHIDDLKEEFHLTSTNYETQLRAMTEHLASLNETVVLERRHIDDLNNQLKMK
ncbi:TTKRSYEDQ domain-containing protein, partial [Aphis craccivora]